MNADSWLSEYRSLMFDNGDESTMIKAAELKYQNMPNHLYKYRSFCDNHINALEKGVLFFSSTDTLDDTKESNIVITDQAIEKMSQKTYNECSLLYGLPEAKVSNFEGFIHAINKYYKEQKNANADFLDTPEYAELKQQYDEYIESLLMKIRTMYSVCCFSATHLNNRMWAQYADAHKGFCIEYDFKVLGIDDLLTSLMFPVIYVEDNRIFIDDIDLIDGNTGLYAASLKVKSEWSYQQEWRLIYQLNESHTSLQMPKPTAIYLGEKAETDNIEKMIAFCKGKDIPLFTVKYDQRTDMMKVAKCLVTV